MERDGISIAGGSPRLVPREIWAMCREIVGDASGHAARIWLGRQRNKVAVGAIRAAALEPLPDGTTVRTWTDERARRIAALGLALVRLARPASRRGKWTGLVRGVTRGLLCRLLGSPWESDRYPSLGALRGTSHDGARIGYLDALERAGLCYRQQLPVSRVEPWEIWRTRTGEARASNRYWVVGMIPTAPLADAEKQRLVALHHAGWEVPTEQLVRAPRRAPVQAQPVVVDSS
jgi:hypothetical protein